MSEVGPSYMYSSEPLEVLQAPPCLWHLQWVWSDVALSTVTGNTSQSQSHNVCM